MMKPDEVEAMLGLYELGWRTKRTGRGFGGCQESRPHRRAGVERRVKVRHCPLLCGTKCLCVEESPCVGGSPPIPVRTAVQRGLLAEVGMRDPRPQPDPPRAQLRAAAGRLREGYTVESLRPADVLCKIPASEGMASMNKSWRAPSKAWRAS